MLDIAAVLGLADRPHVAAPAPEADVASTRAPMETPSVTSIAATPDDTASPWGARGLVATLTQIAPPRTDTARPAWFASTTSMDPPTVAAVDPPLDPLFVPRWTRAIISGSLSVRSAEGPLDIERIVDRMAELLPLDILPRQPWRTARFGAQVLVDIGDAMMPWSRDVPQLRDAIVSVVGRDRCEMLSFEGCPTRGAGSGIRRTWTAHRTPAPPTPIAVISDLGVGMPAATLGRASTGEWVAFADLARRSGNPVVAFVPYPVARVSAAIRRSMVVMSWDRPTSSRDVQRLVGRGLSVAGS
jgi:hypothetical protein